MKECLQSFKDTDFRPIILDPTSETDIQILNKIRNIPGLIIKDTLSSQIGELIKIEHPSRRYTQSELALETEEYLKTHPIDTLSNYIYYPWRNTLVVLLKEAYFIRVRTARNKNKITLEEQEVLSTKAVGVIGLSVGQSVAVSLAMERSFGELRIADFDTLDLSNLNRIRSSVCNLGDSKVNIVAREIAELDPYLKVTVYDKGVTAENMLQFFTEGGNLDLLIEECDSLDIKISSRLMAKSLNIPVLMDTSDRGMIDIERFDLEPKRPIFHGKLAQFGEESQLLAGMSEHAQAYFMSIVDFDKISIRGRESFMEIGRTLSTWPQIGSSVLLGGAACSHFARVILLGETDVSMRLYIDLDEYLNARYEG
ncbi:ThiF family adenylyltransferase [Anditalea andensis]|uniref:Thiamine biosynthesis protein ThiF n=1 Tax=Anditalea andensis TaxID=1048983 RepID=A0A074KXL1_9BACT|nr:ThiF family adenylyltransferase [Anditalea andensis]KEO74711.1 thiamine biosynthesis protein ThiF [Anditalea andensis]